MSLDVILTGLGAIVSGAGGVWLIVHEFRRRERRACRREIDDLSDDLHACRQDQIRLRRWMFDHDLEEPPE